MSGNGYRNREMVKGWDGESASVTCAAASTTVVSDPIKISAGDAERLLVAVTFSDVNEKTGITLALQDTHNPGDTSPTWANVQSASAVTSVKDVQTLTFDTKANMTAGDYFILTDKDGQSWAVATDKTGSDAEPTGALWVAINASFKAQADISGDTSAADVAATFEAAFNGITNFTGQFTSDDTAADGTMTMTAVHGGPDLTGTVQAEDDSAVGGANAIAQTTDGSFTAVYEIENNMLAGTDTMIWPNARVVVITTADDTCTVSSVRVTGIS